MFYQCRISKVQKNRLEQEVRMMRIEIESFKNPTYIKEVIEQLDAGATSQN